MPVYKQSSLCCHQTLLFNHHHNHHLPSTTAWRPSGLTDKYHFVCPILRLHQRSNLILKPSYSASGIIASHWQSPIMSISSLTECFLHLLYLSETPRLAPSDASPPIVYAYALNTGPHGRIGALPFCHCFHWTLLFLPQVPCLEPHVICLSDSFYLPEVCYEFLEDFDAQISHSLQHYFSPTC